MNRKRGFIQDPNFHVYEDDLIIRNEDTRSLLKRVDFNEDFKNLPLFSLVFTEREVGGLTFTTIWQKEERGWLERATSVRSQGGGPILDLEIPENPYGPTVKKKRPTLWELA